MRARWLKPEFFTDKKVCQMEPLTALVYQALWCWADDGGTARADADILKAQTFYRWPVFTVEVITDALVELQRLRRIEMYRVGDDCYAKIVNWSRHQTVHKPGKFRYPRPTKEVTEHSASPSVEGPGEGEETPISYNPRILESNSPRIQESHSAPLPRRSPAPPVDSPDVERVCAHFLARHPRRRIGPKDRTTVAKALTLGYSAEELIRAIDGNAADDWHREKKKHELTYVLRDNGKIDGFIERAEGGEKFVGVIDGEMSPELERLTRPGR